MKTFNITNKTSGADLGNYDGETAQEAFDALARDAGYDAFAQAEDLVITEVKPA